LIYVCSCVSWDSGIKSHNKEQRLSSLENRIYNTNGIEGEYISRVGKRITMLLENQDSNYYFDKSDRSQKYVIIDDQNKILISNGLLYSLENEAEIAALLSMAIVKAQNINNQENDRIAMTYMTRAEYDPQALVNVLHRFINEPWLANLYLDKKVHPTRIKTNQAIVNGMKQGLQRGEENFNKYVLKDTF